MTNTNAYNTIEKIKEYKKLSKLEKGMTTEDEILALEKKLGFDGQPYEKPYVSCFVGGSTSYSEPGRLDPK